MGVHVKLTVIPEQIDSAQWQKAYEETLSFLNDCPMQLMGLHRQQINSNNRLIYTRRLEHDPDEPTQRHWHVVGDFKSMTSAESFVFYHDMDHYRRGLSGARHPVGGEIIESLIEGKSNLRRR